MPLERSLRARLVAAGILILCLAAGFILGFAVNRSLEARSVEGEEVPRMTGEEEGRERQDPREGERRREGDRREGRDRRRLIVEQVDLTPVQKARVDSIVAFHRERMRALHEEFEEAYMPRYGAIIQDTREAIKKVLQPEQRMAYDSLLAEHDRRRRERRQDEGERRKP